MTHDEFLSRLDATKRAGSGHVARCPAHEDKKQSLGVHTGDDGRTLVRCYAGCTAEEVMRALGLEMKDLFEQGPTSSDPEAVYDYVDENGALVMQALRFPGKNFRQRRPATPADGIPHNEGPWVWKLDGVERVPYHLPDVLEAISDGRRVYIVEGEKDADAITAAGSTATCNPGGAGKWQGAWGERYFKGAHVFQVVDMDEAGKRHAQFVRDSLAPHVASYTALRPLVGKDAYDHLRAGHGLDEFAPFALDEITDGLVLVSAAEMLTEDPEWIEGFEDFFPYGAISMLFGHPGVNKSTLTCRLAALVTLEGHGAIFMGGLEDGSQMKPRLFAAGADLAKCHFLGKKSGGNEDTVHLPHDVAALELLVERTGTRLLVVDPIDSALGLDVDSYKAQAVRYALTPLAGVAQRHKVAIVMVSHLNQDKSMDPHRRAGGPRFTGLARACAVMGVDRENADELRILASFKNSWGRIPKSKTFRLEQSPVPGREEPAVKVYEFGVSPATAKGLLYEPREGGS